MPALVPEVVNLATEQPPVAITTVSEIKTVQVLEHPIARHTLTRLRDRQTTTREFRLASNQLLLLLAHEATRSLPTRDESVETAGSNFAGQTLSRPVIFLSITRHGLGLTHQLADFIPEALVGTISLDSAGEGLRPNPRLHIANAPALGEARVIVFEPIVASGVSASLALNLLRRSGATDLSLLSFVISAQGLDRVQKAIPDLQVWTAAIDREWDAKRGPVPGIENFAGRLYG